MFNFLAVTINTFEGFGYSSEFNLNFIGNLVKWLIDSFGNIGVGIIVFAVCLKLVTLPLDIYSRVSMRKNSLKMERMRKPLEKLQRQYAQNKELYSQKVRELYKKEGYSMMSQCLPSLVTIAVFILVINQFNNYSTQTNLGSLNKMANAYTTAIVEYDSNIVYADKDESNNIIGYYLNENNVFIDDSFSSYKPNGVTATAVEGKPYLATFKSSDINALAEAVKKYNAEGYTDVVAADSGNELIIKSGENYVINESNFINLNSDEINELVTTRFMEYVMSDYANDTVIYAARTAAANNYHENQASFLWIKNIWEPDLAHKHPLKASITEYEFSSKLGAHAKDDAQFNEITAFLGEEKEEVNGYYILVVLSILSMFLSQFIMMRAQKGQMDMSAMTGQPNQSKMMTIALPIIIAIFAFFYSAAFSLYMTTSTLVSLLSTVIINFIVNRTIVKKFENE